MTPPSVKPSRFATRRSLRAALDAAIDVINEQADQIERFDEFTVRDSRLIASLRAEVAALRRQNLALDAQLDHMTRVNQALDAGITTTSTQERA